MTIVTTPVKVGRGGVKPPIETRFKPGKDWKGNAKGRPKATMSKKERLQLLAYIARHGIEAPVTAGHKIAAIDKANLMEGVYQEAAPAFQDNRTINIIVSSEKAKELTENAYHRFKEIEAERKRQED